MSKFWSNLAKQATPYVPGEQIDDEEILKLNTNENPYAPSSYVLEAISQEIGGNLRLYPSPTVDQLREVMGEYYQLEKECIFVGNGSDEVLALSFMAFFNPGQMIRFPNITYSFYPVYAQQFQIPYEEVPLKDDFTLNPIDFYESEGGVIFPNPNAPTSLALPIEEVENIVKNNPNNVVIIDEAYVDFAKQTAVPLIKKYPNILIVQTTSKSRSLAGLRVGYALGNPNLIQALNRMKDSFNSYTIDRLAIAGAIASFQDDLTIKENVNKIINTRKWVTEALRELGFQILPSETNFIFATHPKYLAKTLYERLKQAKILTRHFPNPLISHYLRVSIGTNQEMEQFLNQLQEIMENLSPINEKKQ